MNCKMDEPLGIAATLHFYSLSIISKPAENLELTIRGYPTSPKAWRGLLWMRILRRCRCIYRWFTASNIHLSEDIFHWGHSHCCNQVQVNPFVAKKFRAYYNRCEWTCRWMLTAPVCMGTGVQMIVCCLITNVISYHCYLGTALRLAYK